MNFVDVLKAKHDALTDERSAVVAEMEAVTAAAVAEERSALTTDEDAVLGIGNKRGK